MTAEFLRSASDDMSAAAMLAGSHPGPAVQLAYDGIRKTLSGFLHAQGIRSGSEAGHHAAVVEAATAQLGPIIGGLSHHIRSLRALRTELEYPTAAGSKVTSTDATEALEVANDLYRGIAKLVATGEIPLFTSR